MKKYCMNCNQYFDPFESIAAGLKPLCLLGLSLGTTMGPFFKDTGEDTYCPWWEHEAEVFTK